MTNIHKGLLGAALIAFIGMALFIVSSHPIAQAAFPNLHARFATTTTKIVGPGVTTVVTARDTCASRVISTRNGAVLLSFDENTAPSATRGHLQSASTSIAYDSELYGCGPIRAFGYSSTTITLTTFGF